MKALSKRASASEAVRIQELSFGPIDLIRSNTRLRTDGSVMR